MAHAIEKGCDVNLEGPKGQTPLIRAVNMPAYRDKKPNIDKEATAIVKHLLDAGADKTIKDHDGKTALDYARDFKHKTLIKLLR